jgi:PAS domain S-box-containing protein
MKYLKPFLLFATVLMLSFGIIYLSGKKVKDAEKEVHEELVNQLTAFLSSFDQQFYISSLQPKYSNRVYARFMKQLGQYERSHPGSRLFSITIQNGQPIIVLSSNSNQGYMVGDVYPLPEEITDSVFYHESPIVLKNSTEHGKAIYKVLLPLQGRGETISRQVVVMEHDSKMIDQHLDAVRNETIVNFALFLIFAILVIGMLVWRGKQSFITRSKFKHLETLAVLVICLSTVYLGAEFYKVHKIAEQKGVFLKYAESYSTQLRNILWNMQSSLSNFTVFASSSEYVDADEFEAFAHQLMKMNSFEAFYYFEDDKLLQNSQPYMRIVLPDSSVYHLKYSALGRNFPSETNLLYPNVLEEMGELVFESRNDDLIYSTNLVHINHSSDSTAVFIVVTSVPRSLQAGDAPNAFIAAVINPKNLLDNAFRKNEWLKESIALGLTPNLNTENDEWLAAFPPEHLTKHKFDNLDKHLGEYRFHQTYPIFIWNKVLGLSAHSMPSFEKGFYSLNAIYIIGIAISILITILVFMIRVRWIVMQSKDLQQTAVLNRRVRDLTCIKNVSDLIQQRSADESFYHKVIHELHQTLDTRDIATIIIHILEQSYFIRKYTDKYQPVIAVDMEIDGEIMGQIDVRSVKKIKFQKEDIDLLHQISRMLSNFLEREIVAKALKDSELKFRSLVENAFDAIYTIEDRQFTYVNKAFIDMVDYTKEEMTAEDFDMDVMMTEASREIVQHRYECRKKGIEVPNRYEFQQKTKHGKIIEVEASTVSVSIEGKAVVIGILRDVTERKKAEMAILLSEEKLQQQNEELQVLNEELAETNEQIRTINADLRVAKDKAEASDRLKTAFLNNISHELRTPLNGIIGSAILLTEPDNTLEEKKSILDVLSQSSDRLVRTITGYMDISMLDSGEMPVFPEKVNVRQMMGPLITKYTQASINKKIKFNMHWVESTVETFFTDKNLLEKIIEHLLDNAVKFTEKGTVECQITLNDSLLEIAVIDTGIGIDADFQKDMFNLFIQEDNTNIRKYDGSGLGLAIVKNACDLIGATIHIQSEKLVGTSIVIRIDNNILIPQNDNKTNKNMNSPMNAPLILIAEDEDSNFTVLNILLTKRMNARTIRANNGVEAVQLCRENPEIAIVLMDIKMPLLDGYEATIQIKEFLPQLPIIAITAFGLTGDESKALAAGCDDYIAKPIQTTQLIEKVNKWLKP